MQPETPSNSRSQSLQDEGAQPRKKPAVEILRSCVGQENEDAWRELSERFGPPIRNRLRRAADQIGIEISTEEAHELCQDLFLSFFTCSSPFGGQTDDEFWAYINQSVHRLAIDLARYRHAERRRGFAGTVPVAGSGIFRSRTRFGVLGTRERDPERTLLAKEKVRSLTKRCLTLCGPSNFPQMDAVRLTLFEGWTSKEASRHLNGALTAKQVDNVVGRLRRLLDQEGISVNRRESSCSNRPFNQMMPPVRSVTMNACDLPIELRLPQSERLGRF